MSNSNRCNRRGRGCMDIAGARRWENYPYYGGPCASVEGTYECDCDRNGNGGCPGRRRRFECCNGIFAAYPPQAVAANGIIPLVAGVPCRKDGFEVHGGMITVEEKGTYLATLSVRVPDGAALNTTVTLNVDDASQSSAVTQINSETGGAYSAQAIFQAEEGANVALRSSDAINVTDPSAQPVFTLSLVQLEE